MSAEMLEPTEEPTPAPVDTDDESAGIADDDSRWSPLVLPRSRLKMLDYATQQEQHPDEQNIGYSARVFAQVSVPLRDPGNVPVYERRNGNVVLSMRPARIFQPDGTLIDKYPSGLPPRLMLTFVATEAFITKSPVVELGRSMRSFLSKLGVEYSGRNARKTREQMDALFNAEISISGFEESEKGYRTASEHFRIAQSTRLWWATHEDEGDEGLFASEIRLSPDFYESIINSPVPVDLNALRALGGSSLRVDIYLWSTHRMYYLTKPTRIKWEDLNNQFGAQYKRPRAFRDAFKKALAEVQIIYPALNAEATEDYLILRPSLTHVRSNRPYKQLGAKKD